MEIILCTKEAADDYLMHWRTKGSKNGVRRWQYEDGSLTPEGYKHYADMYGWGKKLKKAERLQNKADKAADKADKASRRADDDYVKAHNANQKNDRRGTERSQEKADAANDRADLSKENAEFKSVKARQAQRKASDYADKLQRKEDKMSKYVDENGDLNEKALKKYTYETGLPGERKMSLVGRLKFGNEYADKFNERYKNKMTKEETKAWEEDEKKKFDEENRKDKESDDLSKQLKASRYGELDKDKAKALGDSVLNKLAEYEETERGSRRHEHLGETFTNFLYDRLGSDDMYEKLFALDKLNASYNKLSDVTRRQRQRANEIRKSTGKSGDSLSEALRSDLDWGKLNTERTRSKKQLCSEILQELGFSNTARNRDMVFNYMYLEDTI